LLTTLLILVASTRHALLTLRVSLKLARRPSTQFANSTNKVYKQGSTFKYKICSTKCKISIDKNALQALEVLQPYIKSSKVTFPTSLRRGILTRFAIEIFFLRFTQCKKTKKSLATSYVQGQPFPCPQPRILLLLHE
jgi:hypothetical protein